MTANLWVKTFLSAVVVFFVGLIVGVLCFIPCVLVGLYWFVTEPFRWFFGRGNGGRRG